MKILIFAAVVFTGVAAADGKTMCGDCNADGQVLINELVAAVNNALSPDMNQFCGFDCSPDSCQSCLEFPSDSNVTIQCSTSICYRSDSQLDSCINFLNSTTNLCYPL